MSRTRIPTPQSSCIDWLELDTTASPALMRVQYSNSAREYSFEVTDLDHALHLAEVATDPEDGSVGRALRTAIASGSLVELRPN